MQRWHLTRSLWAAMLAAFAAAALTLAACGGSGSTTSSSPSVTPSASASGGASEQHGLVWKFDTGAAVRSSPAVSNGVVYIGSADGHLYAVDANTGQERWKFKTGKAVYSSPAIAGGVVYVGSADGRVYAVDADNGQERWKFKTGKAVPSPRNGAIDWELHKGVFSSPAVAGGTVYFGAADGHLYAVDANTGQETWRFKTGKGVYSSPGRRGRGGLCRQ